VAKKARDKEPVFEFLVGIGCRHSKQSLHQGLIILTSKLRQLTFSHPIS